MSVLVERLDLGYSDEFGPNDSVIDLIIYEATGDQNGAGGAELAIMMVDPLEPRFVPHERVSGVYVEELDHA